MKKLMIAAAAAAMIGGAYAAGLCTEDPEETGCAVYDVKFTFKSLDRKLIKSTTKSACSSSSSCCTYLDNANYTFNGIIWDCEATCESLYNSNFVLWYTKKKMALTAPLMWAPEDSSDDKTDWSWVADVANFPILNRYGKTATKAEAFWTVPLRSFDVLKDKTADTITVTNLSAFGRIYAAGFGTFDAKKSIVKSISGNAVAYFANPKTYALNNEIFTVIKCDDGENLHAIGLCDELDAWCDAEETLAVAASGTWSIKYNATLSKGKKSLKKIVPTYAQKTFPVDTWNGSDEYFTATDLDDANDDWDTTAAIFLDDNENGGLVAEAEQFESDGEDGDDEGGDDEGGDDEGGDDEGGQG